MAAQEDEDIGMWFNATSADAPPFCRDYLSNMTTHNLSNAQVEKCESFMDLISDSEPGKQAVSVAFLSMLQLQ